MIDLMQLLSKQSYSCIELEDDTRLVVIKNQTDNPNHKYEATWDSGKPYFRTDIPEYFMVLHGGKTARQAIEAAIEARYGK